MACLKQMKDLKQGVDPQEVWVDKTRNYDHIHENKVGNVCPCVQRRTLSRDEFIV